jgi:hypothetical protein
MRKATRQKEPTISVLTATPEIRGGAAIQAEFASSVGFFAAVSGRLSGVGLLSKDNPPIPAKSASAPYGVFTL